jgi:hypothetical protein
MSRTAVVKRSSRRTRRGNRWRREARTAALTLGSVVAVVGVSTVVFSLAMPALVPAFLLVPALLLAWKRPEQAEG